MVVALPIDRWSAPESINMFDGGGLTFWDGPRNASSVHNDNEIHYAIRSGDVAFIDRYIVLFVFALFCELLI
jgi:hypothetical protein